MEKIAKLKNVAKNIKDKIKTKKEKLCSDKIKISKILIGISIALTITGFASIIILGLSVNQKQLFIPTTTATTTTKGINNVTGFSIGQFCLYHNQCPLYAFCSGTCQCPKHYYYDTTIGICKIKKTNGVSCSNDIECNDNVRLKCISSTCQCESTSRLYWNSTYVLGGGLANGRCQNRKTLGQACPVGNEGVTGSNYVYYFSSQIRRCFCEPGWGYYFDIENGKCHYNTNEYWPCNSTNQCHYAYSMCMDLYREGIKRCFPIPTMSWYGGYRWKIGYAYVNWCTLSNVYVCNQWQNLVCRQQNSQTGCWCFDEYYYFNNTMCVLGKRYGETCSSTSQCVPTSISLVCDYPFTGALNTVCRCANGTSYYDITTRSCQLLKTLNGTCRDSSECSGGSTGTMFCGQYNGGSVRVCLCTDAFYPSGTTCVAKLSYNTACSSPNQCYTNLNQTCTGGNCGCITGEYYSSTDLTCQYLKYLGDPCNSGSECWSGTCTSSFCT